MKNCPVHMTDDNCKIINDDTQPYAQQLGLLGEFYGLEAKVKSLQAENARLREVATQLLKVMDGGYSDEIISTHPVTGHPLNALGAAKLILEEAIRGSNED